MVRFFQELHFSFLQNYSDEACGLLVLLRFIHLISQNQAEVNLPVKNIVRQKSLFSQISGTAQADL